MHYIALLRGINVGGTRKVPMAALRTLFESLGFANVSTYINSGNVLFETANKPAAVLQAITAALAAAYGFAIPVLVKTRAEMAAIAAAIPGDWTNDDIQRTDVAYLFPEADAAMTVEALPFKREFIDIRYVRGAIFWNVRRENVYKSQLTRVVGHRLYQSMTIRNVNTARFLAGEMGRGPRP